MSLQSLPPELAEIINGYIKPKIYLIHYHSKDPFYQKRHIEIVQANNIKEAT